VLAALFHILTFFLLFIANQRELVRVRKKDNNLIMSYLSFGVDEYVIMPITEKKWDLEKPYKEKKVKKYIDGIKFSSHDRFLIEKFPQAFARVISLTTIRKNWDV
jgi:hypothetical protein